MEPKDEVSSTYTREEVAAMVEESRGEGLLRDDEYDRLAGALGFTEKTVATVLMPLRRAGRPCGAASTVADVEALCASTGYSRFPVAREQRRAARLPPHQGRARDRRRTPRDRPVDDKWIRPFAPVQLTRPAPRRARDGCSAAAPTWPGWSRPTGRRSGIATLEDVIEELVGEIRDAAHADEPA